MKIKPVDNIYFGADLPPKQRDTKDIMDLRDSTSMRNYELLKKIWAIINMRSPSASTKMIAIENLIKKHRPELKKEK